VAVSCEQGNETSCSVKGGESLAFQDGRCAMELSYIKSKETR
jgi:hypothetical protein